MADRTTVLDQVLLLADLISRDLTRHESETGLTSARMHVLWILGAQGPRTQRELADALDVSPRNVTGLVDALAAGDYVSREPHPTDRRATLVTPTIAGRSAIDALQRGHDELASRLFDGMPDSELAAFTTTLAEVTERFAELMEQA